MRKTPSRFLTCSFCLFAAPFPRFVLRRLWQLLGTRSRGLGNGGLTLACVPSLLGCL